MKKYSDKIEKQVDEELKENGFTRDDFSAEELKDLKDEIKERLEDPDGFMLDGFWSSEGPGLRRQFEKEIGLWLRINLIIRLCQNEIVTYRML